MAGSGRENADELLIVALASGATREEAASKAGVGVETLYRRLRDPEFRTRLDEARTEFFERTFGLIVKDMAKVIGRMKRLSFKAKNEMVQLIACKELLAQALRLRDTLNVENRLAAIEEMLAKKNSPHANGNGQSADPS